MPGEFEIIDWIRAQVAQAGQGLVSLGIGDDCSLINQPDDNRKWLVTTDMLLDGRHFQMQSGQHSPAQVGRKAMAVNLSDIAAMAGTPIAAFVSVALPKADSQSIARQLTEALKAEAAKYQVVLAGGDTNVWDGPLVINITLIGLEPQGGAVLRSGARQGDLVFVSGPLGGSYPSGRHMRPIPRLRLAEDLKICLGPDLHAMIDLSDGLAGDLRHILNESGGLGAVLFTHQIPIHTDLYDYQTEVQNQAGPEAAMEHALCDGEDFELCFCVDPAALSKLPQGVFEVGRITKEPGLRLVGPDGLARNYHRGGFDHFRKELNTR
ncbi:MAG: thiamine-phosphate kinase [Planctomycetota bacterium]|nr:thiamine-phosphate kinase [Planctomycetota bacterium]